MVLFEKDFRYDDVTGAQCLTSFVDASRIVRSLRLVRPYVGYGTIVVINIVGKVVVGALVAWSRSIAMAIARTASVMNEENVDKDLI